MFVTSVGVGLSLCFLQPDDCPLLRPAAAAALLIGRGWIKWRGAALQGVVEKRERRWLSVVCECGGIVALSVKRSVGVVVL